MQPALFEGKYELDSLCAVIKLSHKTWNALKGTDKDIFHSNETVELWVAAMRKILVTMSNQSLSTSEQNGVYPYQFRRNDWPSEYDVYPNRPVAWTGMVRSAFRPSDDHTHFDFLAPSNAMAHVELQHMIDIASALVEDGRIDNATAQQIITTASNIRVDIEFGMQQAALRDKAAAAGGIYSYEVDGFGGENNMDDANVPSLLSMPFIGYNSSHYNATRSWVLSPKNPWFFQGSVGEGVGSPHTGPGYIWPMSVTIRAMTSTNDDEIEAQLATLLKSANNTGFMHESFNKDNVADFTRSWFAWANTLFGELILHLAATRPHLIFGE